MIYSLSGTIVHIDDSFVVVECAGVGYQVFVKDSIIGGLLIGDTTKLFIYDVVRETARLLYGFASVNEREVYEKLLSVSGIGPKTGMSVLNVASIEDLVRAITEDDATILHAVSGIGKKTASKIILELKNKIDDNLVRQSVTSVGMSIRIDVIQALISLGYPQDQSRSVISEIPDDFSDDQSDLLKEALRRLTSY